MISFAKMRANYAASLAPKAPMPIPQPIADPVAEIAPSTDVPDQQHQVQWDGKWWTSNAAVEAEMAKAPRPAPAVVHEASYSALAAKPEPAPVAEPQPVKETSVATTEPVTAPKQNGFESFLKSIGKFFAKLIPVAGAIEASPAVQAAESMAFGPTITSLIEKWVNTAVTVETTAATAVTTANATSGLSGAQKAAIVVAAMSGDAQSVAAQLGASALTQADLKTINDAAVAILNVFQVPAKS